MELDGVFGALALLMHWRAVLCVLISSVLAFLLVHFFPWSTGLQGIVFAVLGLLPGVIWEDAANSSPSTARSTSTSVAVLAAVILPTAGFARFRPRVNSNVRPQTRHAVSRSCRRVE